MDNNNKTEKTENKTEKTEKKGKRGKSMEIEGWQWCIVASIASALETFPGKLLSEEKANAIARESLSGKKYFDDDKFYANWKLFLKNSTVTKFVTTSGGKYIQVIESLSPKGEEQWKGIKSYYTKREESSRVSDDDIL